MKKMLLLAVAATLAVGANAQLVAKKLPAAVKKQHVMVASPKVSAPQLSEMPMQQASEQTVAQRRAAIKRANGQAKAWYNRPAGSFYIGMTKKGASYYAPTIVLPVFREVTFPNASENASSYEWAYKNYVNQAWDSIVVNDVTDLKVAFNWLSGNAPILTADNEDQYQLFSYYLDDSDKTNPVTNTYKGNIQSLFDPFTELEEDGYDVAGFSPKFFTAGNRADGELGSKTYTGALDASGGTGGYWFGKNYSGYNGMAIYCEKPEHPYNLRGVSVFYHNLAWDSAEAGEEGAEITARVYAVKEHSADTLALGDVLAEGKAVLSTTNNSPAVGTLSIAFTGIDEDGLPYEYSIDVDQEIAVAVSGYDNENIKTFCMRISGDEEDEGYGYLGYMLHCEEDGTPSYIRELNNFFTSSLGYTAPTIFLNIEYPLNMPLYEYEDTYEFPVEGGNVTFNATDENNQPLQLVGYDFQSNKTAEFFEFIDENGEYPEWLTFKAKDVDYDEQSVVNQVNVTVKAEPLPEGVAGRVAKMKIGVPGGYFKVKFVQGEEPAEFIVGDVNGDGEVSIADLTMLASLVSEDSSNERSDVNGDGETSVADITTLVNILMSQN